MYNPLPSKKARPKHLLTNKKKIPAKIKLRASCTWEVKDVKVSSNNSIFLSNDCSLSTRMLDSLRENSFTTDDYNEHLCTILHPELLKYYKNRFSLFSLYNSGIILDKEGWYSVTPEVVAQQHASKLSGSDLIVDLCCGCGGNAIQFAMNAHQVYAIDMNPVRLRLAKYNAGIYKVASKIEFILSDWIDFISTITTITGNSRVDAVFISPPWGGISYLSESEFDVNSLFNGMGLIAILKKLSLIASKVALFLPRTSNQTSIIEAAKNSGALDLEIEENRIGKFKKGITVYLNYHQL